MQSFRRFVNERYKRAGACQQINRPYIFKAYNFNAFLLKNKTLLDIRLLNIKRSYHRALLLSN